MYVRSCGICHVYGRLLFIFETHLKYFSRLDPLEVPKNMYYCPKTVDLGAQTIVFGPKKVGQINLGG